MHTVAPIGFVLIGVPKLAISGVYVNPCVLGAINDRQAAANNR